MASDVSDRLRRQIIERAYHVCEYCLVHEDDSFYVSDCRRNTHMTCNEFYRIRPASKALAAFFGPVSWP
jgi:hypothetical protein